MSGAKWRRRLRPSAGQWSVFVAFAGAFTMFAYPALLKRSRSVVPSFQTATYPWTARPRGLSFMWPQSDQAESSTPWALLAGRQWRSGHLPLWDPLSFGGGSPWANDGVAATLYPVRALIDSVVPYLLAHDVFIDLHLLAAGVGLYLLSRAWGVSRVGGCVAGIGWMLNAYVWTWAPLEMVTPFFAALPLTLAAAHTAMRSTARWRVALAAVVLAVGLIAQNIAYAVIVGTCTGLYLAGLVVVVAVGRDRSWRRTLLAGVKAATILVTGVLLAAVVLIPTVINLGRTSRKPFTFDELRTTLLTPWHDYARMLPIPESPPAPDHLYNQFYLTPVVLALAVIGLLFARRFGGWSARIMLVTPILIASSVPGAWLAYHLLPGFNAIRPYARLLPVSLMAVYLLAGLGLDVLVRVVRHAPPLRERLRLVRIVGPVLALLIVVGVAVPSWLVSRTVTPPDLSVSAYPQFPDSPMITAIRAASRARSQPLRIMPLTMSLDTSPPTSSPFTFIGGTALAPGIATWGGYDSALPARTSGAVRIIGGEDEHTVLSQAPGPVIIHPVFASANIDWGLLCRLGTDLVTAAPVPAAGVQEDWGGLSKQDRRPVYSGPDGRVLALPRSCSSHTYLSSHSVSAASDLAAVDALRQQGLQSLRQPHAARQTRAVVLSDAARDAVSSAQLSGSHGRVLSSSRSGSDLDLRTTSSGKMWMVLPVSYDPGWQVTIDGHPATTYRVDFNRLAVLVGPGKSTIHASFRPDGWTPGLILSLVGAGFLVVLLMPDSFYSRLRRRRTTAAAIEY